MARPRPTSEITNSSESVADQELFIRFLLFHIPLAYVMALIIGVFGVMVNSAAAILTSMLILVYSGALFVARRAARRGRLKLALSITCGGMGLVGLLGVLLAPAYWPLPTLLPLLAVAIALPYLPASRLRLMIGGAWLLTMTIAGLALFSEPHPALIPIYSWLSFVSVGIEVAVILVLLWLHHSRMERLLAETRAANETLRTLQEQLKRRQANELTTAGIRTRNEFLVNMSHEIRTPLNAIAGLTRLLLDTPLNQEQREYVEITASSSDTLLSLLNAFLDLSKIEAGRLELEQRPFNLYACVEGSFDPIVIQANEKQLLLAYLVDDNVPDMLIGDPVRLRQVLLNLLSNAVKFTAAGRVTIHVSLIEAERKDTIAVRFQVQDTGIGIPDELIQRIFEPFNQGDATITRHYGGTGLGLTISHQLVQMMGGRFEVASQVGSGSTFAFTARFGTAPPSSGDLWQPHTLLSGRHALICVSDSFTRRALVQYMRRWGITETSLVPADMPATIYQSLNYDLLILDAHNCDTLANEVLEVALPLICIGQTGLLSFRRGGMPSIIGVSRPVRPARLREALLTALGNPPVPPTLPTLLNPRPARRILLVEDNPLNRIVIQHMLIRLGYRADVAVDGSSALDMLAKREYDTILMDIQMPGMDGVEVTRLVRMRLPGDRQPHIIAITATTLDDDREHYLAQGLNDCISKPIVLDVLGAAIERPYAHNGHVPPVAHSEAGFDPAMLRQLRSAVGDDGDSLIHEVVSIFLATTPQQLAEMQQFAAHDEFIALARTAHQLKSSSASIGVTGLAAVCAEIERRVRAGDSQGLTELIRRAEQEFQQVQALLTRL